MTRATMTNRLVEAREYAGLSIEQVVKPLGWPAERIKNDEQGSPPRAL